MTSPQEVASLNITGNRSIHFTLDTSECTPIHVSIVGGTPDSNIYTIEFGNRLRARLKINERLEKVSTHKGLQCRPNFEAWLLYNNESGLIRFGIGDRVNENIVLNYQNETAKFSTYLLQLGAMVNMDWTVVVECPNDTYGMQCEFSCGHCVRSSVCDRESGICSEGCSSGWNGLLCNIACDNGTYGQDCHSKCGHCLNGLVCNRESGFCPNGCEQDWGGDRCDLLTTSTDTTTTKLDGLLKKDFNTSAQSSGCDVTVSYMATMTVAVTIFTMT
ncbi:uncharacterized protein LOC121374699 [Gigantopelta aegis]|uniref:uncharacterized protein LOC121374699 n=1 Tax=Gigantopelta aegis TaxID=1735272 RepID=UPI001B88CEF9|nr:uncharacterized protein LOC121374699 [Gigantopelta aegis]